MQLREVEKLKLSSREKIMVGGLAVIVAAYSIYNFVFMPKLSELKAQKERYEANIEFKSSLSSSISHKDSLSKRAEAINLVNREIQRAIPQCVHQEEVIVYLENVFKDNNINTSSITFADTGTQQDDTKAKEEGYSVEQIMSEYDKFLSEGKKIELKKYLSNPNSDEEEESGESKNEGSDKEKKSIVDALTVDISFSGSYSDLKNALLEIEQSMRKVLIKSVAMNNTEQSIMGTMTLEFPYYYENESQAEIEWNIVSSYGNSDPFMTGRLSLLNSSFASESKGQNTQGPSEEKLPVQSDFYMVLKPASSDMPTVTMGKSPYRHTAVYDDINEFANLKLVVKQDKGKYMYRYENSISSYPAGGGFEEMNVSGESITLTAYSMSRLNASDSSGAVLKIENNTDKQLQVIISRDDKTNPRLKVVPVKGKVMTTSL